MKDGETAAPGSCHTPCPINGRILVSTSAEKVLESHALLLTQKDVRSFFPGHTLTSGSPGHLCEYLVIPGSEYSTNIWEKCIRGSSCHKQTCCTTTCTHQGANLLVSLLLKAKSAKTGTPEHHLLTPSQDDLAWKVVSFVKLQCSAPEARLPSSYTRLDFEMCSLAGTYGDYTTRIPYTFTYLQCHRENRTLQQKPVATFVAGNFGALCYCLCHLYFYFLFFSTNRNTSTSINYRFGSKLFGLPAVSSRKQDCHICQTGSHTYSLRLSVGHIHVPAFALLRAMASELKLASGFQSHYGETKRKIACSGKKTSKNISLGPRKAMLDWQERHGKRAVLAVLLARFPHISDKAGKDHCHYQKTASSPSAIQQCPRQTPVGDHTLQIRYQLDAVLEPYTAFYSRVKQASHRAKAGMGKSPRGHSHSTEPHIQPGVVFSQRQLHSLQRVEGLKQQAPLQPTRTTTRPYACGLGLWNIFMLPREQDISQKQWDILLTTMISPIYLHQGPTKLGKGTPGDAQQLQFTEVQNFQAELEGETGMGKDATHLSRDRNKPPNIFRPNCEQQKAQSIQTSSLFNTYTLREMLKRSPVPSRGSYQTSDQRDLQQRGTERRFSPSRKAETGLESLVDQATFNDIKVVITTATYKPNSTRFIQGKGTLIRSPVLTHGLRTVRSRTQQPTAAAGLICVSSSRKGQLGLLAELCFACTLPALKALSAQACTACLAARAELLTPRTQTSFSGVEKPYDRTQAHVSCKNATCHPDRRNSSQWMAVLLRGGGRRFEPGQKSPGPPVTAQGRAETGGEAQIAFHLASWLRGATPRARRSPLVALSGAPEIHPPHPAHPSLAAGAVNQPATTNPRAGDSRNALHNLHMDITAPANPMTISDKLRSQLRHKLREGSRVLSLQKITELNSSRLEEGSFCPEVRASSSRAFRALLPDAKKRGLAQQRVSLSKHSTAWPELHGWGHEHVVMSDRSGHSTPLQREAALTPGALLALLRPRYALAGTDCVCTISQQAEPTNITSSISVDDLPKFTGSHIRAHKTFLAISWETTFRGMYSTSFPKAMPKILLEETPKITTPRTKKQVSSPVKSIPSAPPDPEASGSGWCLERGERLSSMASERKTRSNTSVLLSSPFLAPTGTTERLPIPPSVFESVQNAFKIITNWNTSRTTFSIHSVHAVNHLTNRAALERFPMCYYFAQISLAKARLFLPHSTTQAGYTTTSISLRSRAWLLGVCMVAVGDLRYLTEVLLFQPSDRKADDHQGFRIL
ncbi:hypothetical protein Anapl_13269 [Anas platyrhynchos]|uniref:Uncharacterized protein n=1 Tax=Anas platyrhynchos TaxID=8839 RepID=R0LEP9_ANAPL|nr:hypothetical protein Anapl_13269 [Anas platyrhynchos]